MAGRRAASHPGAPHGAGLLGSHAERGGGGGRCWALDAPPALPGARPLGAAEAEAAEPSGLLGGLGHRASHPVASFVVRREAGSGEGLVNHG